MFDIRKIQEEIIYEAVKRENDDETAKVVVYGDDGSAMSQDNASWAKSNMRRLENKFDPETTKKIRMACQCGYGMDEKLALIEDLIASSSCVEEFACSERAIEAGLFYQDGVIHLQFQYCPCPMIADVDKFETNAWCQCSTGYSKVLFEKAFGCKVEVELLKSIKMGDDVCLMTIIPHDCNSAFNKRIQNE